MILRRWTVVALLVAFLFAPVAYTAAYATEQITAGYPSNSARTKGEMKQFYEDIVSLLKEVPGGIGSSIITLASDTFALPNNQFAVVVAAQTGTTDNINTVTGNTRDGRWLVMRADTGDQITINHLGGGTGQFFMQDATALTITDKTWVIFQYNEASLRWEEIARDGIRMPGGATRSTITLDSSGYATPTGYAVTLDTFASAASDNADRLVTTNKVPYILVRQANASRIVTLRHNIGGDGTLINRNSDDIVFDNTNQAVLYERVGTTYEEIARFGWGDSRYVTSGTSPKWGDLLSLTTPTTITMPNASAGVKGQKIRIMYNAGGTHSTVGGTIGSAPNLGSGSWFEYTNIGSGITSFVGSYGTPQPLRYGGTGTDHSGTTTNSFLYKDSTTTTAGLTPTNNTIVGFDGSGNPTKYNAFYTASAEQTVSTGSQTAVSHGLGRMPYDWYIVLRCKTADAGYAVGDEIRVNNDGGTANRGFTMWVNTTQIGVSTSNSLETTPKAGGSNTSITTSSWRWVMYYK